MMRSMGIQILNLSQIAKSNASLCARAKYTIDLLEERDAHGIG